MREIKFRAWYEVKEGSVGESTMVYWYPENPSTPHYVEGKERPFNLHAYLWNNPNHTVMQYTGADDKDGTPIYEGDIITHPVVGMTGVVVWNTASYCYSIDSLDGKEFIGDLCDFDYEPVVIGNIYQNKELLKNG